MTDVMNGSVTKVFVFVEPATPGLVKILAVNIPTDR